MFKAYTGRVLHIEERWIRLDDLAFGCSKISSAIDKIKLTKKCPFH
jgi:hypothetical protein